MSLRYLKYYLIFCLSLPTNLFAQSWKFQDFTAEKGLSYRVGKCCIQDSYGFMWIGTEDGLNKYDGYEFTVYRNKKDDTTSIGGHNIINLFEDSNNQLWISTESGIYKYIRESDNFRKISLIDPTRNEHYNPSPRDFIELDAETFLLSTSNGLFKYNKTKNQFLSYRFFNVDIYQMVQDRNGKILASTQGKSVISFSPGDMEYSNYPFLMPSGIEVSDCEVIDLEIDKSKNVWAAVNNILYRFDDADKRFEAYNNIAGNAQVNFTGSIRGIFCDSKNQLWISTDDNGLSMLNLNDNLYLANIQPDIVNPEFIFSKLYKACEDKSGNIWVPCLSGVRMVQPVDNNGFQTIEENTFANKEINLSIVSAIYRDSRGILWVGTDGNGLFKFDKELKKFVHFQYLPQMKGSIGSNSVLTIYEDNSNRLWFGGYNGGLYRYDEQKQQFSGYKYIPGDSTSLSNNDVRRIYQDESGVLWIATKGGGINKLDLRTGKFSWLQNDENNPTSLVSNYCLNILETSDKKLVFTTYNGFSIYDPQNNKFVNYLPRENDSTWFGSTSWTFDLLEDEFQNLWMATNDGLFYFNRKKNIFYAFNTDDGLPGSYISSVKKHKNELWISTKHGLSKLSIDFIDSIPHITRSIKYKSFGSKMTGEFSRNCGFQSATGYLYFGGFKGITYFHPDSIRSKHKVSSLVFTEFLLYYSPVSFSDKNAPITKHISLSKLVRLKYDQKVITFKFSALNYNIDDKPQYAYKLENIDKDWIQIHDRNELTFTNLEAGTYTLKIKTWNEDGTWEPTEASMKIIVLPPWWASGWFRIFLSLFILSFILTLFFVRLRLLRRNNFMLKDMVYDRTVELEMANQDLTENQDEIERQKEELQLQKDSLFAMNQQLEIQKQQIIIQNIEIEKHNDHLEDLVVERTKDLERALEKAEESDRLKTHFLHNMSHEIRTPMNAIMGFADIIRDAVSENEDLCNFADIIRQRSSDLLQIIDDILEISKIETGLMPVSFEEVNLSEFFLLLNEFFKGYNQREKNKKLELIIHPFPETLSTKIITDKSKLRQIFINLLYNAFKFTNEGKVEMGCRKIETDKITFFVTDTGIGIEQNKIPLIFDRFMQIDNSNSRSYGGTGLGLAIVKELLDLIGGEIHVDSIPDKGSTFTFTIPIKLSMEKPKTNDMESEDYSVFTNKTVLIVEDDIYNARYLQALLSHKGITLKLVYSGDEAIKFITTGNTTHLVLMDVRLPGIDGYEVTKIIKQKHPEIIIIAQTAYASATEPQRALDSGCDDYISKPINRQLLLSMMKKHLQKFDTGSEIS